MLEIKNALRSANPIQSLVDLVMQWSARGTSKQNIFNKLNKFQESMSNNEFTELDEENITEVMDRLSGWCAPDKVLLPDEDLE